LLELRGAVIKKKKGHKGLNPIIEAWLRGATKGGKTGKKNPCLGQNKAWRGKRRGKPTTTGGPLLAVKESPREGCSTPEAGEVGPSITSEKEWVIPGKRQVRDEREKSKKHMMEEKKRENLKNGRERGHGEMTQVAGDRPWRDVNGKNCR